MREIRQQEIRDAQNEEGIVALPSINTLFLDNESAWNCIFRNRFLRIPYRVKKENHCYITSKAIKPFREPRLMTKFDHKSDLPDVFLNNHLSILPVSRGCYCIAPFETFHTLETDDNDSIKQMSLPDNIQSLACHISSEATALSVAAAAGIFIDFFEINLKNDYFVPTVSGRMASGVFDFRIDSTINGAPISVQVKNAQIEIDAAYESRNFLAIFEAKNKISDDFIIRQLYYPYRLWKSRIRKEIRPVFLVYSNGVFHLREYSFEVLENYNSIKLVKQKRYSLEDTSISKKDILKVLAETETTLEVPLRYPQADSFERIINLCELLREQPLGNEDITDHFSFTSRQTDYYLDAVRYLGLLNCESSGYALSDTGKSIFQKKYKERQLALCEQILRHKIFHESLGHYFNKKDYPTKDSLICLMKSREPSSCGYAEETYKRRASTILAWIKWIVGLINK